MLLSILQISSAEMRQNIRVMTVVDSTQGKNDVVKFFNIPKEKIRIIPHIPPNYIIANSDMTNKTKTKF